MNRKIFKYFFILSFFILEYKIIFCDVYKKLKKDYIENLAPKISDYKIHNIKFQDNNEKLIDLTDKKYKNEKILFPYTSHPYKFKVREGLQKALFKMVALLPKDIGIFVYSCYRPINVQKELIEKSFLKEKRKNPLYSDEKIYEKVFEFLSPVEKVMAPHSTGGAIDMVLIDLKTKKLLAMGRVFEADKKSHTFNRNISNEERRNRKILLKAALKASLINYPYEFWHFSYGDNYWAYYMNKKPLYKVIN